MVHKIVMEPQRNHMMTNEDRKQLWVHSNKPSQKTKKQDEVGAAIANYRETESRGVHA